MIPLLRRAAIGVALACAWSTPSPAQSTEVITPTRTELPRMLPQAPIQAVAQPAAAAQPAPAAPFIQQSPNGLYQMAVTDTGIVLRGPKGTVVINAGGIQIGSPSAGPVKIESMGEFRLRIGRAVMLESGTDMTLRSGIGLDVRANAGMLLRAAGPAELSGTTTKVSGAMVTVGGCTSARPAARLGDQVQTGANPGVITQGSGVTLVC
jgi:hypothetical protein